MKENNGFITHLDENEIIVVGTNLAGRHYGGAANQAHNQFSLEWGVGEGLSGQTYAFPTLDGNMEKRKKKELLHSALKLNDCARQNPEKTFYLTKVGQGIAGFTEGEMNDVLQNLEPNIIKI